MGNDNCRIGGGDEHKKEEGYQGLERGQLCPVRKIPRQLAVEILAPDSPVPKDWGRVYYADLARQWPKGAKKIRVPVVGFPRIWGLPVVWIGVPRDLEGAEIIA